MQIERSLLLFMPNMPLRSVPTISGGRSDRAGDVMVAIVLDDLAVLGVGAKSKVYCLWIARKAVRAARRAEGRLPE